MDAKPGYFLSSEVTRSSQVLYREYCILNCIPGLDVNFLVHLQSFANKDFFHQQTDETTSKFLPFVWKTWMIQTRKGLLVDIFRNRN